MNIVPPRITIPTPKEPLQWPVKLPGQPEREDDTYRILGKITSILGSIGGLAWRGLILKSRFLPNGTAFAVGDDVVASRLRHSSEYVVWKNPGADTYVAVGLSLSGVYPNWYWSMKIAWTPSITTATWHAINNQPPAMYNGPAGFGRVMALDASTPGVGYVCLPAVGAASSTVPPFDPANPDCGPNIWRNSNLKTGTWTQILSKAIFAALTGWSSTPPDTQQWFLSYLHSVAEAPGFIVVGIQAPNKFGDPTETYILHSHDYGATWSYYKFADQQFLNLGAGEMVVCISKADPNVIFAMSFNNVTSIALEVWRSDDGGHTFAKVSDDAWGWPDATFLSAVWGDVNIVHAWYNALWKSTDKGVSWNSINATPIRDIFYLLADGSKLVARSGSTFRLSLDGGVNYTSKAIMGSSVQDFCVVQNGLYAFSHNYAAGVNTVTTIDDALNEVDVTGDLHTVLGPFGGNHGLQIQTARTPYP